MAGNTHAQISPIGRTKGDQRILGDSGFVCDVLKKAEEKFERYYEMKRLGYDLDTIEDRVCEIYKIEKEDLFSRSRQRVKSDARALFCFWAHREPGLWAKGVGEKAGGGCPSPEWGMLLSRAKQSRNQTITGSKTELVIYL